MALQQNRAELLARLVDLEYGAIGDTSLTEEQTDQLVSRCIEQVDTILPQGTQVIQTVGAVKGEAIW